MWQFISGFGLGIYVGSYYDCKPVINTLSVIVKENFPKERKDFKEEQPIIVVKEEPKKSFFGF